MVQELRGGRRIWNKGFKKWKHLEVLVLLFWEWKKWMRTMRTFLCLSIISPSWEKSHLRTQAYFIPPPPHHGLSVCPLAYIRANRSFWETENKVKCLPIRSQCFGGKDRRVHNYYKWIHIMLPVVTAIL